MLYAFVDVCADHRRILPKSFTKPDIYEHFSKDYLFLAAIKFINQVSEMNTKFINQVIELNLNFVNQVSELDL